MTSTYVLWLATAVVALMGVIVAPSMATAQIVASDNATDTVYVDDWVVGDDGGMGYGAWEGSGSYGFVPTMEIDTVPLEPDNDLGATAFRLGTGGARWVLLGAAVRFPDASRAGFFHGL